MAYVNAVCAGHVTIFSTGGKFRPVLKLHTLTLAARYYVLLVQDNWPMNVLPPKFLRAQNQTIPFAVCAQY